MFLDMKIPSPTSMASWLPSPCLTSSSSDGVISANLPQTNLTFVLYGRIVSGHDGIPTAWRPGDARLRTGRTGRLRRGLVARGPDPARRHGGIHARRQPGGREFVYGKFVDALWNR